MTDQTPPLWLHASMCIPPGPSAYLTVDLSERSATYPGLLGTSVQMALEQYLAEHPEADTKTLHITYEPDEANNVYKLVVQSRLEVRA